MGRILVIDDEADIARFVRSTLAADEHEVSVALDGGDGLRRAATDDPDLVAVRELVSRVRHRLHNGVPAVRDPEVLRAGSMALDLRPGRCRSTTTPPRTWLTSTSRDCGTRSGRT